MSGGELAATKPGRHFSSAYGITAGTAGTLGLAAAWFLAVVADGSTPLRLATAALLLGASLRLLWAAVRGGVWITPEQVLSRGVLATSRVVRSTVTSVSVITDHRGVSGQLNADKATPLRGVTNRHRHSPRGSSDCSYCARNREAVAEVAESLKLPLT